MTALVVGGSSGTGLATAHALARAGTRRIALVGRDRARGEAARGAVERGTEDVEVLFLRADASDSEALGDAVASVQRELGGLDVAVSSVAPSVLPRLIGRSRRTDLADQLTEVALPAILLIHTAMEAMRERGGSIVVVASDAAKVPTPGESIVGAGMAAITMYARVAALEGKRHGVRVNVVTPSLVTGTATTDLLMADEFSARLFAKAQERAALGPTSPEDVADLVAFLSGPAAARVTGQVVSVNAGLSAF